MNDINYLEHEYPGDIAWENFVAVYAAEWDAILEKRFYVEKLQDVDFAKVLATTLGEHAINWFSNPCPALEGDTPKNVLASNARGRIMLRTLIMRMPK